MMRKKIWAHMMIILIGLFILSACGIGPNQSKEPGNQEEIVLENEAFKIYEPTPGTEVENSIVVRGLARVYEGTIHYEFEDGHFILAEGFTTASEAAPEWGEFEIVIEFDAVSNDSGTVILFEESAIDGSRLNELLIPVKVKKQPGNVQEEIVLENEAFKIFEPTPGAEVENSIVVRGLARVFEGTIQYEFEDGHFILAEGFTTSSEGAPGWGEFEIVIELDETFDYSENGTIILFEESAKDGSRLHELQIPVKVKNQNVPEKVVLENEAFKIYEPTPGTEVGNSIVVRGLARVFEGTIQYEFEDGHFILAEGFTTASEGGPGWGEFEIVIEFDAVSNESGTVILFEESAKDGSRLHELLIPVKVTNKSK